MQSHLEVQKKVQEIFDKLKSHEHAALFNKFLDKNHQSYNEVVGSYTTLELLILGFQTGDKYKSTDEVAADVRKMIQTMMKMAMQAGEQEEYQNMQDFNNFFTEEFQGMEN